MKRGYLQLDGPSEAGPALTLVSVAQARSTLAELLDRVLAGEVVVISRRGRPVVRLTAELQPRHRLAALWLERLQVMHQRAGDANRHAGDA